MEITSGALNTSMLCDFYELTMINGYFDCGKEEQITYFDLFFRRIPDDGGYAIAAGLEQAVDYLENLRFTADDIDFLRKKRLFSDRMLDYLRDFRFSCDIWAMPEGTPIFPHEPLFIVRGPAAQAQLIETMLLLTINHQSLIATKANRIVRAAQNRPVMEFGARRAHGAGSALYGARAAYIGGCSATSCTLADVRFGIPSSGTMAHSWVQMFPDELAAFKAYARSYPDSCTLLVDTYDTLRSGLPNAIRAFDEEVVPRGFRPSGIRIDSGDITYLSFRAREMLDDAGYPDCKIIVSNALNEHIIRDTIAQGARVDAFGVGEQLITSRSEPVFGGVYKLAAVEDKNGNIEPKIKLSENIAKITTPCFKTVWRLYDKATGMASADLVTLSDETIDETKPLELFHPEHTWKRRVLRDFRAEKLLVKVFENGKRVYDTPSIGDVRTHCQKSMETIWPTITRLENPHEYHVDLSPALWKIRHDLLDKAARP